MSRIVDYYFSMHSPWAYIGHVPFVEMARRHNLTVTYRPISLPEVFSETGGLPVAKRHPARLRYRILELQRWREKRRLNFKLHPKFFPFDAKLADQFVVALIGAGYDADPFLRQAFAALWEHDQNLAEGATLIALAYAVQLPGERLLADAKSPGAEAEYDKNTRDAIAIEVVGSPSYVLDGEVFWGQDRLELLEDAIQSGRRAFCPDT
jgi:2-hydroxychromene-2-carboxylate isomerase